MTSCADFYSAYNLVGFPSFAHFLQLSPPASHGITSKHTRHASELFNCVLPPCIGLVVLCNSLCATNKWLFLSRTAVFSGRSQDHFFSLIKEADSTFSKKLRTNQTHFCIYASKQRFTAKCVFNVTDSIMPSWPNIYHNSHAF